MDDDDELDLFITFSLDVKLIRILENVIVPSDLSITVGLERNEGATDATVELALTKWRYWFEHIVAKTIAFGRDNSQALDIIISPKGINRTGNLLMLTPDDPSDEMLGALFQSKMNALANGNVSVITIDIRSDNLHGLSFTLAGDHSVYLPKTVEEWLGGPSYFEKPWWHRNDAASLDTTLPEGGGTGAPPAWAYSLDFLDRSRMAQQQSPSASVPGRPAFQPTVISGGKSKPKDEPKDDPKDDPKK